MYYIITDINGCYEVDYKSAAQIIDDASSALFNIGSSLEEYAGISYHMDSDGDVTLERNLGDSEAFTAAKRFFQDDNRFDVYCAQDDIGEFIWHADEIDIGYEARALVTDVDPDYARDEFGV